MNLKKEESGPELGPPSTVVLQALPTLAAGLSDGSSAVPG